MEVAALPRRQFTQRRLARWAAPALYLTVLAGFMWRDGGVPVARDRLLMWIVLGLLAVSTTNLGGWLRSVALEWLPFALVLWVYDLLRGLADGLLFAPQFTPQIDADRLLFAGDVPTVWLQEHLWDGSSRLHWYDFAAWAVYMELLRGDLRRRRSALVRLAAAFPTLRRDGLAPRRDGLRHVRSLPGRAALAREPRG